MDIIENPIIMDMMTVSFASFEIDVEDTNGI